MDSKQYFDEVVRPLGEELKQRHRDRSIIMAAAIVSFHACDWIAAEREEERRAVRERISDRFPDFKYLRAVASAHKHMEVDNPPEFDGLTNPLSPGRQPEALLTESGDRLLAESGDVLTDEGIAPMYSFADGTEKAPLKLISGAIEAISQEFE